MKRNYIQLVLLILTISFCTSNSSRSDLEFRIQQRSPLSNLPSASGTSIINDTLFVAGDDSPWIYKLDHDYSIISKLKFGQYPINGEGVIPKADKPDLEALASFNNNDIQKVFAFGSGSIAPQRDILVIVNSSSHNPQTYSLQQLYNQLRLDKHLQNHELNIEAAAIYKDNLILLNRGKNLLIQYQLTDLLSSLKDKAPIPTPKIYKFTLPEISQIEAGFSGAAFIPGTNKLIFTASAEDTPNAVDDGEILGSMVGIIKVDKLSKQNQPATATLTDNGTPLKVKAESVSILENAEHSANIILVTDSDGGKSEIITGIFNF